MLDILGEIFRSLGRKGDAADASGSVLARLQELLANRITPARAANLTNLDRAISALKAANAYSFVGMPAAGANAILADSGPLAAGDYELYYTLVNDGSGTGSNSLLEMQHRNAANAATLTALGRVRDKANDWEIIHVVFPRFTLALNERIRCIESQGIADTSVPFLALLVRLV